MRESLRNASRQNEGPGNRRAIARPEPARRHCRFPENSHIIGPSRRALVQPVARSVGPVTLTERIQFIDVLRGMALFGILAANMRAFFAPLDTYGDIQVLFHSRADVI